MCVSRKNESCTLINSYTGIEKSENLAGLNEVTLNDLLPYTNYSITVIPYNYFGFGTPEEQTIQTDIEGIFYAVLFQTVTVRIYFRCYLFNVFM